jgi:hypothetical protein
MNLNQLIIKDKQEGEDIFLIGFEDDPKQGVKIASFRPFNNKNCLMKQCLGLYPAFQSKLKL